MAFRLRCRCGAHWFGRREVVVSVEPRTTERHGRNYCVRVKHGAQPFKLDGYLSKTQPTPVTFTRLEEQA